MNTRTLCFVSRQRGFTFVELVISLVIIGVAVVGVLLIFTTTVASSADPMIRQQALAIAQGYLDEVISKGYVDPDGVDGEGSRVDFDDIDDYVVVNNATPALPNGTGVGLDDYRVTVTVGGAITFSGVNVRPVTSTVVHQPTGETISLWSYRAQY